MEQKLNQEAQSSSEKEKKVFSARNEIVVSLDKCQWARFGYMNQRGNFRLKKPDFSVHNVEYNPIEIAHGVTKTMKEHSDELGLTDVWTPYLILQLSANHQLRYSGDKAVSVYKEWCGRIFNKSNKSNKKKGYKK